MQGALAAGQVQTTWPGSQTPPSVIGMKQEPTQPENNTAEGVLANLWTSQGCVRREARERKKQKPNTNQTGTETKQKVLASAGLPCWIHLACSL